MGVYGIKVNYVYYIRRILRRDLFEDIYNILYLVYVSGDKFYNDTI